MAKQTYIMSHLYVCMHNQSSQLPLTVLQITHYKCQRHISIIEDDVVKDWRYECVHPLLVSFSLPLSVPSMLHFST